MVTRKADVPDTVLDEALDEVTVAFGGGADLREGLLDYSRLNLKPETMAVVQLVIAEHGRRVDLLSRAKDAIEALLSDGYPELPTHEVTQLVYDDLAENNRTIDAAFAHFGLLGPVSLNLTAGPAEPKGT